MRFLMKIPIPTAAENPIVREPQFNETLRTLFLQLGAKATYSNTLTGRRIDYVIKQKLTMIYPWLTGTHFAG